MEEDGHSTTEIGSLVDLLDSYDGPDNWKSEEGVVHGLEDDDWIYERSILESVASQGPSSMSGSKTCESISHQTFMHDTPATSDSAHHSCVVPGTIVVCGDRSDSGGHRGE